MGEDTSASHTGSTTQSTTETDASTTRSDDTTTASTDAGAEMDSVAEVDSTMGHEETETVDPVCNGLERHRVFVTESTHAIAGGNWSLALMDEHCRDEASKVEILWPGRTFLAIASDDATDARDRLEVSCGPLYMESPSGIVQVAESGLLWDDGLQAPIDRTAAGDTIAMFEAVWTGTHPDGLSSGSTCGNWTGNADAKGTLGLATGGDWNGHQNWISYMLEDCGTVSVQARFYCIEQP